jgi:hypothetical protein
MTSPRREIDEHGADRIAVRAERRRAIAERGDRLEELGSSPSASRSSISIGMPVACASGASVWRQQRGLDKMR